MMNQPQVCWVSNSEKLCRCCFRSEVCDDFFEMDFDVLKDHLNLFLSEDPRLPTSTCPNCRNFLEDVKKFRDMVTATHTKLMKYILNGQSLIENISMDADKANDPPVLIRSMENVAVDRRKEIFQCTDPLAQVDVMAEASNAAVIDVKEELTDMDCLDDCINMIDTAYTSLHTQPVSTDNKAWVKDSGLSDITTILQVKRPRGRPRKHPLRPTDEKTRKGKSLKKKSSKNETKNLKLLTHTHDKDFKEEVSTELSQFEDEDICNEVKKRKRGEAWCLQRSFSNAQEAEDAVKMEDTWSMHYIHNTDTGKKYYYRCRKMKRRGPQCSAKLYLLFENADSVLMYKTRQPHDHDQRMGYLSSRYNAVVRAQRMYDTKVKRRMKVLEKRNEAGVANKMKNYTVWNLDRRFEDADSAEAAVKGEGTWSHHYDHSTDGGKKCYFRCNKLKRRGPQCSAKIYLLFEKSSQSVQLFRSETTHDHDQKLDCISAHGLSDRLKNEINKMADLDMKPKTIIISLMKRKDIEIPKMSQLRNYLNYYHRQRRRTETSNKCNVVFTG